MCHNARKYTHHHCRQSSSITVYAAFLASSPLAIVSYELTIDRTTARVTNVLVLVRTIPHTHIHTTANRVGLHCPVLPFFFAATADRSPIGIFAHHV